MIFLNKINALVRYEILNLKRGRLKWIIAILYFFGIEQALSTMFSPASFLSLVGFIKFSWLPINLIMIPLILIFMKIGESENEIFKAIDISHKEFILSKFIIISIICGIVFAFNIAIAIVIGLICRVSISYFLGQIIGYVINTLIALIICAAFGLFIGQTVCKNIGDILGFILSIIFFIIICNFYKISNTITPLMNIRTFPNSFDVISYDTKAYIFHNILWLLVALILFLLTFMSAFKTEISKRNKMAAKFSIAGSLIIIIILGRNIFLLAPSFYDIGKDGENRMTYVANKNSNFHINKYDMNITLGDEFKNHCRILLTIDKENTSTLELGLYNKLNIISLKLNKENIMYKRTANSFIVKLPRTYNKGETIELDLAYEGLINTAWIQNEEFFFVRNNAVYLADAFEWYPKLNDYKIKEYNLIINNKKNKIYTNLEENNSCKYSGKVGEIFLISGNIKERSYKGISFIGNEEYINNNKQCNNLIPSNNDPSMKEVNQIILTPFTYGGYSTMKNNYINSYLYSER